MGDGKGQGERYVRRHAKRSAAGQTARQGNALGRTARGASATRGLVSRFNGSGAPAGGQSGSASPRLLLVLLASAVLAALVLGATAASALAPVLNPPSASNVQYSTAHLEGEVNPEDKETTWWFEYVSQSEFESSGFAGATQTSHHTLAENSGLTPVSADIGGLSPETKYHLRLVAENESGEVNEEGSPFETLGPVTKPSVSIDSPSLISAADGSFAFTGHVNPGGTDPAFQTTWHFSCEPSCGEPQGGTISPATNPVLVEAEVSGLNPKTTYTVTLHATNAGGEETAQVSFKTPAGPPLVEVGVSVTNVDRSITLRGKVKPRGSAITDCHFAYGTSESYGQSAPCLGRDEVQKVSIGSNVTAGQFKLAFESQETIELGFDASAEEVQGALEALSPIGSGNVSIRREDPGNGSRLYLITFTGELGSRNVPLIELLPGATPLNGISTVETVTQGRTGPENASEEARANLPVSSLIPGATYHFRLEATTQGGSAHSADSTFRALGGEGEKACPNEAIRSEQHATFLPACRAYEQASPVDKGGGEVMPLSSRTRAASDGNAVSFASLVGSGDVRGTGIAVEYLAQRRPDLGRWVTHSITPTVPNVSLKARVGSGDTNYEGDFSADFGRGLLVSVGRVAGVEGDETVKDVPNLYLRDNLRSAGAGEYKLISACPACDASDTPLPPAPNPPNLMAFLPRPAGASSDLEHVAFESLQVLTSDTPAQSPFCGQDFAEPFQIPNPFFCAPHLYEWDHGQLRLAGVLPDGSPADASFAGGRAGTFAYTPHVVSDGSDGHSRIEFTQPTNGTGQTFSEMGLFEQAFLETTGNLFQRIDGTETVKLNRSEREACLPEPEPQPCKEEFQPAKYLEASPDGERVFFVTAQALTDDARPGQLSIYMYDASKPATDPHNLTLVSPEGSVQAMVGIGGDGHYAYYLANGRFVAWQDGVRHDIGQRPGGLYRTEQDADGLNYGVTERRSRVSPDGRYLLFTSDRPPFEGGYDHGVCPTTGFGCRELYVYSADTNTVACASCNPSGAPATADANDLATEFHGGAAVTSYQNRAITNDGRVFFTTAEKLVPGDTNGVSDAYEYNAQTGDVSLISTGTDANPSFFVEASTSGHDVFFATRQQLVGWDTDNAYDLYDARVGGGLPEPPPATAPCEGDSCQGGAGAKPADSVTGSAGLGGPGNPKPRACPKGRRAVKRHGKVRCVKRHHKRHAKHNRRVGR